MLKFKFLLWVLSKLMQRAINKNPACAKYAQGKQLAFRIQTDDGIGRYFFIKDGAVRSVGRFADKADFTLSFRNAARGFAILSAKDGKEAFLSALHDQDIAISGNFVEVMWFQGFTEFLQPGA